MELPPAAAVAPPLPTSPSSTRFHHRPQTSSGRAWHRRPLGGLLCGLLCCGVLTSGCRHGDDAGEGGRSSAAAPSRAPAAGSHDLLAGPQCGPPAPPVVGLLAAGSGSNLALIRRVAQRWMQRHPGSPVTVPPSIGTSGALRAVRDRAIGLGLVSRALRPDELATGLVETPLAEVDIVLVAAPGVAPPPVSPATVARLIDGSLAVWPDGSPVVPLLREWSDSSNQVLAAGLPGYGPALQRALAGGRWRVCLTDQQMEQALLSTPGGLGLLDLGTLRLGALAESGRALRLADYPDPAAPPGPGGRYPFTKRLGFVTLGPPAGEAARFIAYARSAEVSDLLLAGGYRLLPAPGPAGTKE